MKLTSYIQSLILLLTLATGLSLQSCADDLDLRNDTDDAGENFTGITLLIPNIDGAAAFGASRSDEFANSRAYDQAREGNFNTLYIAAVDNNDRVQVYLKTSSNGTDGEGYSKYRVNLEAGKYKFYIVANLNRYTEGDTQTFADIAKSEVAIRNHILHFNSSRPLEPGFLPMACLNENIRVGNSATNAEPVTDSDGYVTVPTNENVYIYADLNYLCAKVRYTIIFDRDKSQFAAGDIIDVHRNTAEDYPYATNLREQTALNPSTEAPTVNAGFIKETSGDNSKWPIFLDRYIYDGNYSYTEGDNEVAGNIDIYSEGDPKKIKGMLNNMKPWSSEKGSWTAEDYLNKRAWQGVAYLPENLLEDNPTLLKFPYSFNGGLGAESPRTIKLNDFNLTGSEAKQPGIKRSMMYDVYALVTTPDPAQWTLNVIPSEWTLQELAYQLHGPYDLIVENSSIKRLSMQEEAIFWFRSSLPPEEIGFSSPYVMVNEETKELGNLYVGGVLKDDDGNYIKNENGDYLFHIGFNLDIPYSILNKINQDGGFEYEGDNFDKSKYTIKDISYFHIIAGSLQKRIEIEELDLNPYLVVSPQTIIIDTRELYTSGKNEVTYRIDFKTNVDIKADEGIKFTLADPSGLIGAGVGNGVLKISDPGDFLTGRTSPYNVTEKSGYLELNIDKIIEGSTFWDKNNEFTLTFKLVVPGIGAGAKTREVEQKVTIKVRPFSGNYTIHFRDNTKDWEDAHIYVYQLLTLPSDLTPYDFTKEEEKNKNTAGAVHPYAGKIVGFIERNPSSGLQWNAAVQYVFSNNLSFKGWKGYGGPEINNPWEKATVNYTYPEGNDNWNKSTMGFVMFGDPDNNGFWNYSYAYNVTWGIDPNPDREERYNYDVNFNADHEAGLNNWHCWECINMKPDYNDNGNDRFYTGITMEKEADGWWKYTLTGVAQPGRTMIIFANFHKPWDQPQQDYTAEDNRWPGDYETGLPLFDFEDNEGWFLFDGNTTNSEQRFTDDKPVSKVIPHNFTSDYKKLRIYLKIAKPNGISVNGESVAGPLVSSGEMTYIDVENFSSSASSIPVVINGKTYNLAPKNFKYDSESGMYVTVKPLYDKFNPDMELFVKWNDHVSGQGYNPGSGTDVITITNGGVKKDYEFMNREYGNYKYVRIKPEEKGSNQLTFELKPDGNFSKTLNVEKLPEYYIPSEGYYLINVHKL